MSSGKVVRRWVSRFDIYPYLERYTVDAAAEINRQVCSHVSAWRRRLFYDLKP